MDTILKTRMAPSLGLLTLMNLTPPGHAVVLCNENIEKIDFDMEVDLVGITVTVDVFPRACAIAAAFRARGIPVIAGGIHVTCVPETCAGHFDAICVGPAERVWAKLLADAQSGALRPVYRDMENFRGDEIVSPQYAALADSKKYLYTNVVLTSRGCPHRCDFCYNSAHNRCCVWRPVADVVHDIQALKTRHIFFVDDNFIGNPAYTRELLSAIKDMRLSWNAAVTAKILQHLDLLDLMVDTGCKSLFIGFESVNSASLKAVHKDNDAEDYDRLVRELHARGIMINASMVFGLDADDENVFDNTLDWLIGNKIETVTAHILTPYPGTVLHERMRAAGRITDEDLAHYNTANVVYRPERLQPEALFKGYLRVYKRFYSFKNIFRRCPKTRRQRMPFFLFNFLYRKFGKFSATLTRLIPIGILGRISERLSYRV
ncbi:MAG: radical SAM protein [Clostridiales bacterium]|nr:radical SAM protein [Clostridiales bacterium]